MLGVIWLCLAKLDGSYIYSPKAAESQACYSGRCGAYTDAS